MIELQDTWDTVILLFIAFGVGLLGGVAAELLLTRGKAQDTGAIERWRSLGSTYYDLGFVASVLLGGIAAVAILYFFPPTRETVTQLEGGTTETTTDYDLIKLVALSLIVGSAGSRFLEAAQARALAALSQAQVETVADTSKAALDSVQKQANDLVTTHVAAAAAGPVRDAAQAEPSSAEGKVSTLVESIAAGSATAVRESLSIQVSAAKDMIDAAAGRSGPGNPRLE